ncbi:hypothetical protein KFL_005930095, partial [Klebsormidium nitens]
MADRIVHSAEGPRAAHRRLRYRPVCWATHRELAYQGAGGALAVFLGEMVGTLAGPIKLPVQGYCSAGLLGAGRGLGKGVAGLLTRPLRATARLGERAGRALGAVLDRRGPGRTADVWQYGSHVGSLQQQRRSVANVDTPLQGLRAAALALGAGFVSGTAALGAWPAAGYRKLGLLGGLAGAGVGAVALLCHVAGAVVLSAAALLACIPASVEAAGRQVVCWRGRVEHSARNAEEKPAGTQEAVLLDTLDTLERLEVREACGDGK